MGDLKERDCGDIFKIIYYLTGIVISPAKKYVLKKKIGKMVELEWGGDFQGYKEKIFSSSGSFERDYLISLVTTNVTSFFREQHHFDYLEKIIIPKIILMIKSGRPVRIWCAACSTGEEAYSVALVLFHFFQRQYAKYVKILATDIDGDVLDFARKGVYPVSKIFSIPIAYQYLLKKSHDNFTIENAVRDMISFNRFNLFNNFEFSVNFMVIYCRNVAIYFDDHTRSDLWVKFSNVQLVDDVLFLGHSERLDFSLSDKYRSDGLTTYVRI